MKLFLGFSLLFLLSCTQNNKLLEAAIAYGEINELNEYSENIDKQLFVRLLRAPITENQCFVETEGVCQFRYFLSVSTFDEQPETRVFTLLLKGEVVDTQWLASPEIDTATIIFTVNQYSTYAVANNPGLIQNQKNVKVQVNLKSLTETTLESI